MSNPSQDFTHIKSAAYRIGTVVVGCALWVLLAIFLFSGRGLFDNKSDCQARHKVPCVLRSSPQ